jgi:uncharacterized protein (DUF2164 family)
MADKIVAEYIVKTDKAVAELNKIVGRLDAIEKERKQSQDGFKSMSKGMVNDFKKVGAAIGLAFGAQELVSFGKEAVKLASQMEGVERAFKRIGGANSANLLEGLRRATRGTVSDLQLMQKAVQASNFKIPLENLASLFKFAQARARETGESVEYLTNSIVLGIGRKSPLILDNLGISAVELRERLKGVGVEASSVGDIAKIIGEIAEEELAKMGNQADTTADKIEQLNTVLENAKVLLGEGLVEAADAYIEKVTPIAEETKEAADSILELAKNTGYLDAIMKVGGKALDFSTKKYRDIYDSTILAGKGANVFIRETQEASFRLTLSNEELIEFNKLGEQAKDIMVRRWMTQEGLNESMEDYLDIQAHVNLNEEDANNTVEKVIKNLAYYNQLIKDLQAEQANANTTRARVRELEDEINEAIRQRLLLLGKLREVGGATYQEIESRAITELQVEQQLTDDLIDEANRRDEEIKKIKDANRLYDLKQEQKAHERRLQLTQETLSAIGQLSTTISQIVQNQITADLQVLQKQFEEGEITREEFEQKQRELQRKSAQAAKDAALFNAVINTAQAVMQALANTPPPASYALAAVAGALGAAQIAAIASQPLPQFAEGGLVREHGLLKGKTHAQGGIPVEAEHNEYFVKSRQTMKHLDILDAVNGDYWEKYKMENIIAPAINQVLEGGFGGMGASYMLNTNWTDKNLLKQGDRNRYAMRDGFMYLGKEIRSLKGNQSRWN